MTNILEAYDSLARDERTAWDAWFNGGWQNITRFGDRPNQVSFGKAECEWVSFDDFWLGKAVNLGWITATITEQGEAEGAAPGTTFTKYLLEPTDLGLRVREKMIERFRRRLQANALRRSRPDMRIAKMLVLYRAAEGVDQKTLAEQIGFDASTLCRIEAGKSVQMQSMTKLLRWMFE